MADFVLSCCSTADLTKEHFQQRNISYICFHYALDGVDYPDDLGESMPFDKFYAAMANGAETRTSQVNISEFVDYFTPFLEQGKDILHVCLSSGLSGVSNSAENAARIVRERYPDRKIYIVDSLGASSGYGLLMDKLADNYGKANKNPGEKNAESEGLCVALALGTPGRAAGATLVEDQERSLDLDCGRSVAVGA